MSRYLLESSHEQHLTVVGWDNPLQTFFLHLDDRSLPDEADHCICWLGTTPDEMSTVDALVDAGAPYARLPVAIRQCLQQDYDRREPPTPLQQWALRLLRTIP